MQIPEQTQELIDIYGMWHVPFWQQRWFMLTLFFLGMVLIGAIIYYIVRMRSRQQPETVWQEAERAFAQLEPLTEDAQYGKEFYLRLTEILKKVCSYAYGSDIVSLTDRQMREYILKQPELDVHKQALQAIFSQGEMVKFARQISLSEQMKHDLAQARTIVQEIRTGHEPV